MPGRLRSLHLRSRSLSRGLHLVLGGARLVVAAAVIGAVAYVLSWQILYSGPVGNDTLFHLHLARWVDSSFPALHWWYRWDDHGIAYREGYPLAAHWVTAAISRIGIASTYRRRCRWCSSPLLRWARLASTSSARGGCIDHWPAWWPASRTFSARLTWTFLVDWGFYSNQAGTVLFMPGDHRPRRLLRRMVSRTSGLEVPFRRAGDDGPHRAHGPGIAVPARCIRGRSNPLRAWRSPEVGYGRGSAGCFSRRRC